MDFLRSSKSFHAKNFAASSHFFPQEITNQDGINPVISWNFQKKHCSFLAIKIRFDFVYEGDFEGNDQK